MKKGKDLRIRDNALKVMVSHPVPSCQTSGLQLFSPIIRLSHAHKYFLLHIFPVKVFIKSIDSYIMLGLSDLFVETGEHLLSMLWCSVKGF